MLQPKFYAVQVVKRPLFWKLRPIQVQELGAKVFRENPYSKRRVIGFASELEIAGALLQGKCVVLMLLYTGCAKRCALHSCGESEKLGFNTFDYILRGDVIVY